MGSAQLISGWLLLALAIVANVIANISLKIAAVSIKDVTDPLAIALRLATQAYFWAGLVSCGVLFLAFFFALRSVPVSLAYPIVTSLATVGLTVLDAMVLATPIGLTRIIGIAFVLVGIALVLNGTAVR
ncbi:MAG: SMR family transporter [Pseudomonadota bacterium]